MYIFYTLWDIYTVTEMSNLDRSSLFESINASVIKCNECEVGIVAFLEVTVRVSPTLEKCGRRGYQILSE